MTAVITLVLIPGGLMILGWTSARRMLAHVAAWALIAGGFSVGLALIVYAATFSSLGTSFGAAVALFGLFLIGVTTAFLFTIRHWL